MKELAVLAGFQGVFLPRLLALFYRSWESRNPGGQGILLNTDPFWRNWSGTAGVRVDDPENAAWDASIPTLWFLGEQARRAWPDFPSMPYRGDYFLLGQDLREIQAWLPRPLPLSCGNHGLAFGYWRVLQTAGLADGSPADGSLTALRTAEFAAP
ncbi:hypothetical protein HMI48_05275 [Acidithiobacillus ferrooxidans]|uniref:hypothetical protein n=1 Tax=Acidithiobacillus ferrooxidans TaxID=920 RepID=UPI001C07D3FE|nr:hypothetical protein [Acidithiobacillus ferrooxidans]MBU2773337.1 hypothetical protein [Acidithiobacillus ferrooxidans]